MRQTGLIRHHTFILNYQKVTSFFQREKPYPANAERVALDLFKGIWSALKVYIEYILNRVYIESNFAWMETRMHFKLLFLIKMVFGNVCDNPGKNSKKTKILKSKISSGKTIWWVMYRSWNANKWRRWKCQVIIIPSNIKWRKYFMNFVTTVHVYSAISKW